MKTGPATDLAVLVTEHLDAWHCSMGGTFKIFVDVVSLPFLIILWAFGFSDLKSLLDALRYHMGDFFQILVAVVSLPFLIILWTFGGSDPKNLLGQAFAIVQANWHHIALFATSVGLGGLIGSYIGFIL
jgi:hypothetical protein